VHWAYAFTRNALIYCLGCVSKTLRGKIPITRDLSTHTHTYTHSSILPVENKIIILLCYRREVIYSTISSHVVNYYSLFSDMVYIQWRTPPFIFCCIENIITLQEKKFEKKIMIQIWLQRYIRSLEMLSRDDIIIRFFVFIIIIYYIILYCRLNVAVYLCLL